MLGTVQLGKDYGIANKSGQPSFKESREIIKTAWDRGIRYFDTAQGYGNSEVVLGKILKDLGISRKAFIISKISGEVDKLGEAKTLNAIERSLKVLNINKLYGLFLHDPRNALLHGKMAYKVINKIKSYALADRIGVSVYNCKDALKVLESDIFDIVQMPFNIFDQHYFKDNVYKLAKKNDKPVFIRSIFLQGLLLMDALQLPERLKRFAGFLAKRDKLCREFGLNIKELAIGYVKKRACGSAIIFGAETHKQVADTIDIFSRVRLTNEVVTRIEEELSVEDERLIDPSRWG